MKMSDTLPKWIHHIDEDDIKLLLQSDKGVVRQFAQWVGEPSKVLALQAEITRLAQENLRLRTVMMAAAEEIGDHWEAHCDEEGYGPQNLQRHLREGTGYYPGMVDKIIGRKDDDTSY
jgi:hypothetical protein